MADAADQGVVIAVGAVDANADVMLAPAWRVGVSIANFDSETFGALRITNRLLGGPGMASVAWTLGAGYGGFSFFPFAKFGSRPPVSVAGYWVEPALVFSWPMGSNLTLRGSLGPLFYSQTAKYPLFLGDQTYVDNGWAIWPNLEVAFRLDPASELTFGGNGLVGWRHVF
jgi:hypothetical protein